MDDYELEQWLSAQIFHWVNSLNISYKPQSKREAEEIMANRMSPEEFRVVAHRFLVGEQNIRYENLAAFMYKIQPRYGPQERYQDRKPAYTEKALENALRASRILTKDGEVRQERLRNWAKARGYDVKYLTTNISEWADITEGGS